jgi:putative membrane protein
MKSTTLLVALMLAAAPASAVLAQDQQQNDESTIDQITDAVTPSVTDPAEFARMAASSNMFEIQSSQLALDQSQDEQIRSFAQQMIDDHTAAGEKMKQAAEEAGVEVPDTMEETQQDNLEELQQSDNFDQDYLDAQVEAHDNAVDLFEGFSEDAEDGPLRAFAQETLPTLEDHQSRVEELADS